MLILKTFGLLALAATTATAAPAGTNAGRSDAPPSPRPAHVLAVPVFKSNQTNIRVLPESDILQEPLEEHRRDSSELMPFPHAPGRHPSQTSHSGDQNSGGADDGEKKNDPGSSKDMPPPPPPPCVTDWPACHAAGRTAAVAKLLWNEGTRGWDCVRECY